MNSTIFKDYGKIIIRRPLYSYLFLFDEDNKTKNLNDVIDCFLKDPAFMEGIYWSSPQLYQRVVNYKNGNFKVDKENKLRITLMKYAIRASTRCTPYGIFAGSTIANIGKREVNPGEMMERKVRIDVGLLQQIKSTLEADSLIWPHLGYSVNNSLYILPGQYRFIESVIENGKTRYQISSIDQTEHLEKIITLAEEGTVSAMGIYSLLKSEFGYNEVEGFIQELIKNQFLISELQLGVTVENDFERIKKILERLKEEHVEGLNKYITLFSAIDNILKKFLKFPIGKLPVKELIDLEILLDECGIKDRQEHLFQADLRQIIPDAFYFSKGELNGLQKAITILGKLTQDTSPSETQLENFKKYFSEKYETQEIPLAEVLDPEFGVGFPVTKSMGNIFHSSLIEKIDIDSKKTKTETTGNWLIDKIESFDNKITEGIEINENDLKDFDDKVEQLPDNFAVMGTLLPEGKILIQSVGGANANSLLGRFAYLDVKMQSLCKCIFDKRNQKNENIIFAEVIHFPEGRIGNIARRSVLSEYEIPLLAASALAPEKQLPIDDLMVSIQQNEIILRSKKLNKRVIPRLSNAHNYTKSTIPAYRFLCAIQHQGKSGFDINWKSAFTNKKHFFPRLYFKNIILHRTCWFLYQNEINVILNSNSPGEKLKSLFISWNIPKFVCLTQGDNELFIDTTNDGYLQVLLEEMKNVKVVKLVEWLHACNKNSRDNPDIIQFILPLSKMNPKPFTTLDKYSISLNPVQRIFIPGSEWLYFKIYTGAGFSDNILLNVVSPAIDTLLKNQIIKKAFFIRYADPHYHIRFRLHLLDCTDKEQFATAIKCVFDLLNPYCTNRVAWKVQLDTYQREIERYGEDSIIASEEAFFHDSILYLSCLKHSEFANNEQIRFLASLKSLDYWLSYFDMTLEEKASFCIQMSNAFTLETERSLRKHFDLKYREMKNAAHSFLQGNELNNKFCERNKKLYGKALPVENVSSFIHMSMNRWFAVEQRKMEYMAYIFCEKYYSRLLHEMNK